MRLKKASARKKFVSESLKPLAKAFTILSCVAAFPTASAFVTARAVVLSDKTGEAAIYDALRQINEHFPRALGCDDGDLADYASQCAQITQSIGDYTDFINRPAAEFAERHRGHLWSLSYLSL